MSGKYLMLMDYMRQRVTGIGLPPTLSEMAEHCQVSKTQIFRMLQQLERKGLLKRTRQWRGIQIGLTISP